MKVSEFMQPGGVSVKPSTSPEQVAQIMRDGKLRFLPVEKEGKLVGVVTDRDLLIRIVAEGHDWWGSRVADFLTREVISCYADDELEDALALLARHQLRQMPVVDTENRLVGMLTLSDADHLGAVVSKAEIVGGRHQPSDDVQRDGEAAAQAGWHLCYADDEFGPAKDIEIVSGDAGSAILWAKNEPHGRMGHLWKDDVLVCSIKSFPGVEDFWVIEPSSIHEPNEVPVVPGSNPARAMA